MKLAVALGARSLSARRYADFGAGRHLSEGLMACFGAGAFAGGNQWRRACCLVAMIVAASSCARRLAPRSPDSLNLHQVATVFIKWPHPLEFANDAIVKVGRSEWITLDAPPPDPPEYEFEAELTATRLAVHSTTRFGLADRAHVSVVEGQAMRRVADRLFQAWKESAIRAGKLTKTEAKSLHRVPGSARERPAR